MEKELEVIRDLVLWLWRSHEKPWESSDAKVQDIATWCIRSGRPFSDDRELELYLPSIENVDTGFRPNQFLYLNHYRDNGIVLPRISLKCDFGRNIPDVRCRLELIYLNDNNAPRGLGYRFEPPEGYQNEAKRANHHYYHIQITNPMGLLTRGEWLPETQPAFPLQANNSVELIIGLLISLYGLNYLNTLKRDAARQVRYLNEYINKVQLQYGSYP